MLRIYKYKLRSGVNRNHCPFDDILMPKGANILSAVVIDGVGYVYATVLEKENDEKVEVLHRVRVIGTGRAIPEGRGFGRFIGTIVVEGDYVDVWHIFDGGEVGV